MTFQSEVVDLRRVVLRHARSAFESQARVDAEWRDLNFLARPDFDRACREYDDFATLLERLGVSIEWADPLDGPSVVPTTGLDSIYVRDAALVSDRGAILCRMGKGNRTGEPEQLGTTLAGAGVATAGRIEAPGTIEGGDVVWLDDDTLLAGRGYRTNASGIQQVREMLPGVEVVSVPLPHWKGPSDVFHLMSMLSPLAPDLALVYSPLMPVPLRERLLDRGVRLVEVPDEEFDTQGCNVLAVAPRVVVALEGNPETHARMKAAGVEVHVYAGAEISVKGCGGPTCLTRPLERG